MKISRTITIVLLNGIALVTIMGLSLYAYAGVTPTITSQTSSITSSRTTANAAPSFLAKDGKFWLNGNVITYTYM